MLELTPQQDKHGQIMQAITGHLRDTPMVLKGGTALLLAYNLDRFSEDLDFDCDKKIRLEARIKDALKNLAEIKSLDVLKDTGFVTRYRLVYGTNLGDERLKIETSHRNKIDPDDVCLVNGIKTYKVEKLIGFKLLAAKERTVARDLYDIHFLVHQYPKAFGAGEINQLRDMCCASQILMRWSIDTVRVSRTIQS
jgi:predicted nucleotidyltransferase component of viral defense system